MTPANDEAIEHPRMLFFLSFFCFTIGIASGIVPQTALGIGIALVLTLGIVLLGGWKRLSVVFLVVSCTLLGWYLWYQDNQDRILDWNTLQSATTNYSGSHRITGTVEKILYKWDLSSTYRLHIDKIDTISTKKSTILEDRDVGILFEIPSNLHIGIGDTISYTGKILETIELPLQGFARYSWYHRVYGKSVVPMYQRVTLGEPTILSKVQSWAKAVIFRWFPENIAGIILGMTIGNIDLLTSETKKQFTNAGITHILVVSGSNIAFVIIIITGLLKYLPISGVIRTIAVVVFVLMYGSLVGWDMPVIRAVSMGIITYIALEWWKRVSSIAILFLVCICILISSPLALVYDAWFWLSFLGTLGILLFQPSIRGYTNFRYIPGFLSDIISVTIAASIGSMIAIIYHFGAIPLYTLVSNILISGVLGWILFSSVFYLIFALMGGWILYIWGWTIYLPTAYIMWVGAVFGGNSSYTIPESWIEPVTYICIGLLISGIFLLERRKLLQSE